MTRYFLRIPIEFQTLELLIEEILDIRHKKHVHLLAASTLVESSRDPDLHAVLMDGFNICDSRPLSIYFKFFGSKQSNVRGTTIMFEAIKTSNSSLSHYFLGLQDDSLSKFRDKLLLLNHSLKITRINTDIIDVDNQLQVQDLILDIENSNSDVVWLGVGSPKQDFLAAKIAQHCNSNTIAVGAAFDFIAGTKTSAPVIIQKLSLEWFFRLLQEPRRLWRRYFFGNIKFIMLCFVDFTKKIMKVKSP